jgi:hypothetical protein
MMISVLAPFIIVTLIHIPLGNSINSKANQTSILNTVDKLANTPGAVLPLATGLVGFAGGVVTAMFRTSTTSPDKIPRSQGPPGQALPHAVANGPTQQVNMGQSATLDGTGSHAITSGSSIVSYFWVQTAGDPVALTGANTVKPTFTAPTKATNLSFSLIVADSTGAISSPATVTVPVTQQ